MKATRFTVVKKSAGYGVKSFSTEEQARIYAQKCCQANNNANYIVCIWSEGCFQEI